MEFFSNPITTYKNMSQTKQKTYDWPGWSLADNTYDKEFDIAARKRMLEGSQYLLPYIKKYSANLGHIILEIGPFFNPLTVDELFRDKLIFYWDNDKSVIDWLKNQNIGKQIYPIQCDLNYLNDPLLFAKTKQNFTNFKYNRISFESVIASQIFNYINYRQLLAILITTMKPGSLLFINNVVDYGLPAFFSSERPKTITETIVSIEKAGYKILEYKVQESPYPKYQKNERLLLVAQCGNKQDGNI